MPFSAAIHDPNYTPVLPTLAADDWAVIYQQGKLAGALENLGDAVLRFVLSQLSRRAVPSAQPIGTSVRYLKSR